MTPPSKPRPRPRAVWRRAMHLLLALSLTLSSGAAGGLAFTAPAQASPLPGGPPGMPEPFALPAQPITGSTGVTGYLPGSWSVTPSGSFAYGIALDVPAGRAGMQPNLSLQYDSGSGTGTVGAGWSLTGASSRITRCPGTLSTDGAVTGLHYDSTDHLCLDGQKLVRVDGVPNGPPPTFAEYRTEDDAFAQITGAATAATAALGADTFTVRAKSGLIRTYTAQVGVRSASGVGWNPDAVTGDVHVSSPRVAWLLTAERDRSGNEVQYEYDVTTGAAGNEYLPHRIVYTAHASQVTPLAGQRHVDFAYENRADPSFRFEAGVRYVSTKRLKTISMYGPNPGATALLWQYNLSYTLSVAGHSLLSSVAKCGAAGGCLRAKKFAWQTPQHSALPAFTSTDLGFLVGFNPNKVRSPFTHVVDLNGDGADDLVWTMGGGSDADSPVQVRLGAVDPATGAVTPVDTLKTVSGVSPGFPAEVDLPASRLLDLSGDGTAAIAASYTDATGPHTELLHWDNGSRTFAGTGISVSGSRNTVLADVDGDGRPDYLTDDAVNGGSRTYSVRLNTGGAFGQPTTSLYSSSPVSGNGACPAPRVTDTDGDGRGELVGRLYTAGACSADPYVLHLDANSLPVTHEESATVGGVRYDRALPQLTGYKAVTGDFNGDHLEDYLLLPNHVDAGSGGWDRTPALLWNTGAGLVADSHVPVIPHDVFADVRAIDVNGDGRSDLVSFNSTTSVWLSAGDGTFSTGDIAPDGGTADVHNGRATSVVGDFNGDGRPDVLRVSAGRLILSTQQATYPDLLLSVSDEGSVWARQTVSYSTAWTDHPEKIGYFTCGYPVRCIRRGLVVVRQVASRDHLLDPSAALTPYTLQYSFEDPATDLRGRGFLGFGVMRVWDPQRPVETVYNFSQHKTRVYGAFYPYVERPQSVTATVPLGTAASLARRPGRVTARVTRTTSTYELRRLNGDRTFTVLPKTDAVKEWEQDVTVTWGPLSPATAAEHLSGVVEPASALRRVDRSATFDDFGNQTGQSTATANGAAQTSHVDYDNRVGDWLIGLPVHESATGTVPGNYPPAVTRTTDRAFDALGRLTTTWAEKGNANADLTQTTGYVLNDFATVDSVTVSAAGLPDRVTRLVYGTAFPGQPNEYMYPTQTWSEHDTAAYRPSHWTAVHPGYGVTIAAQDANGVQTISQFDDLGRPVRTSPEGQDTTTVSYANRPDAAGGTNGTVTTATVGAPPQLPRLVGAVTDALGRTVSSTATGFDGQANTTGTRYDVLGRVSSGTTPAPGGTTGYTYDTLDRLVSTTLPDGSTATAEYTFFTSLATSPGGTKTTSTYNVDGQLVSTALQNTAASPPVTVDTTYTYGPFGLLSTSADDQGHTTAYGYDARGRQIQRDDPDQGWLTNTYYGTGDLRSEHHQATNHTTVFGYDDLGRNVTRQTEDGTTAFTYDTAAHGIGRLAQALSTDGIRIDYRYDTAGRQTGMDYTDQATGATYQVDQAYTATGRLATTAFPQVTGRDRFTLSYGYNSFGIAATVSDVTGGKPAAALWTVQSRTPSQALDTAKLGSGAQASTEKLTYDSPTGRLHNLTVANQLGAAEDLTYGYQADGLVSSRTDAVAGRAETFGYDSLNELTSWKLTHGNQPAVTTGYAYDTIGNLTQLTRNGAVAEQRTYGQAGGGQPHTLTGVAVTGGGTRASHYDGQGRQTDGDGRVTTYTAFNLPRTVTTASGTTTVYAYDAFGQRVKESSAAGSTFTVPGRYEHRVHGAGTEDVFFVDGTDGQVGQVVYSGASTTVEYALHDGLGSVTATVDAAGAAGQRFFYEPFGARTDADGAPPAAVPGDVTRGFTGDRHDDAVNLIDMGGRVYDPAQHTFLTPDPLNNPSANPYTYVRNSPLNYTDPTGYTYCDASCQWYNDYAGGSFEQFAHDGEAYQEGGAHGLAEAALGNFRDSEREYRNHVTTEKRIAAENAIAAMIKSDSSGTATGEKAYVGSDTPAAPAAAAPAGQPAGETPAGSAAPAVQGTWDPYAATAAALAAAAGAPLPAAVAGGLGAEAALLQCQSDPAACQQAAQAVAKPAGATASATDTKIIELAEEIMQSAQKTVLADQDSVEFWSSQLQKTINQGPGPDRSGNPDLVGYERDISQLQQSLASASEALQSSRSMYDYSANRVAKLKHSQE